MQAPLLTIHLARKPLAGNVVNSILKFGSGGLNIAACRLPHSDGRGRWPANAILVHSPECKAGTCVPECPSRVHQGFKAVRSEDEARRFLLTLISSPDSLAVVLAEPSIPPPKTMGVLVHGWAPTREQMKGIFDSLTPGAHICLFAPETQPTGHMGAILLEDTGFEIRDALLLVRQVGGVHHVPKPSRAEREAGCDNLKGKLTQETVSREAGSAGTRSPRAGAGRGAGAPRYRCLHCGLHLSGSRVLSICPDTADGAHEAVEFDRGPAIKNHHPTVKPIALMRRLLKGIHGTVVDPFLGSGGTGIACVEEGCDFIGIEQGSEYLEIADARVRHADCSHQGWLGATIQSDVDTTAPKPQAVSLEDFFD